MIKNFSVSQVSTFIDCERKHFMKSILKLEEPLHEAAQRGVAIHKANENLSARLETGIPLDQALVSHDEVDAPWMNHVRALSRTGLFPLPGESHAREHRFSLDTHLDIPFIGVIDLILDERNPIDVIDWKSVGDIRYAKTPNDLLSDLQLAVYAHYIFQSIPDDIVRTRLAYVEAKKKPLVKTLPRTAIVTVDLSRDHARRIWEGDLPFGSDGKQNLLPPVLERIRDNASCTDFNDIEPNTATCDKYGGCPFRTKCGLSPFASVVHLRNSAHAPAKRMTIQESKNMGFLSKNNVAPSAQPTNGTNGTPTATPAPAITAPATTTPAGKPSFLSRVQGTQAAPSAPPAVPTGVTPPDAPSRMTPVSARAEDGEDGEEAAVEAEAPKKRGRPKKATEEERQAKLDQDFGPSTKEPAPVAKKTGAREFVLYVDCFPTKGAGGIEPTMMADWFGAVDMRLNELASKENLPSWWLLDFAPQKAALAIEVQNQIKKGLPPAMVVRTGSNEAREVLPFLLPHATQVVQAVR